MVFVSCRDIIREGASGVRQRSVFYASILYARFKQAESSMLHLIVSALLSCTLLLC